MELFTAPYILTACIVFGLMWAVLLYQAFTWMHLGRLARRQASQDVNTPVHVLRSGQLPPLSVIITAHNQAHDLERNLPAILEQDYPDFEVIVVNSNSTDETEDLLKRMELKYPHLRHTFTPPSARYISLRQLALTLGFRAAVHEWVALTDADCAPVSALWLQHMAAATCQSGIDIVLGYANFPRGEKLSGRRAHFQLLHNRIQALHYATKHGAYRYGGPNLIVRKSLFLQVRGFAEYNQLLNGAEEILVSRTGNSTNTNTVITPLASVVRTPLPRPHLYAQERLYSMETRKHLVHKFPFRITAALKCLSPDLALCTFAAGLMWSASCNSYEPALASSALYLAYLLTTDTSFNSTARMLGERPLHPALHLYNLILPFLWISSWLRYCTTPRKIFRKKAV